MYKVYKFQQISNACIFIGKRKKIRPALRFVFVILVFFYARAHYRLENLNCLILSVGSIASRALPMLSRVFLNLSEAWSRLNLLKKPPLLPPLPPPASGLHWLGWSAVIAEGCSLLGWRFWHEDDWVVVAFPEREIIFSSYCVFWILWISLKKLKCLYTSVFKFLSIDYLFDLLHLPLLVYWLLFCLRTFA